MSLIKNWSYCKGGLGTGLGGLGTGLGGLGTHLIIRLFIITSSFSNL